MAEDEQERREHGAVFGGGRGVRTLEDVEEQERPVDRWAARNPGTVDQGNAAIAREVLRLARRSIGRQGGP